MVSGRVIVRLVQLILVVAALAVGWAAPAQACDASNVHAFGLSPGCFDMRIAAAPTSSDRAPEFFQAGGHPYEVTTVMRFNAPSENDPTHGVYWTAEALRDVHLSLPTGLVANPTVVPSCTVEQLSAENPTCPSDSQVGVLTLFFPTPSVFGSGLSRVENAIYRVGAPPGSPPRFGFNGGSPSTFEVREGSDGVDGISINLESIAGGTPLTGMTVALWGVPADPAHTPDRACPGEVPPGVGLFGVGGPLHCPATLPERALLRLPTSCTGPSRASARVDSWQNPGDYQTVTMLTHRSPGLLGDPTAGSGYPAPYPGLASEQWGPPEGFNDCDQVPFDPSVSVRLDSAAADTPTGLDLEVSLPQQGMTDPLAVAESDLREAVVKLPVGLSLNSSVANGLSSCSAAQFGLESNKQPACPDSSKLGTVEVRTPLIEGPLKGSIYSGAQDASGGSGIPAFISAGSTGMQVKLRSGLEIDPSTGRISASFANSPQVPISSMRMHFFGGNRAPFISPSLCGRYTSEGRFTPWSGGTPVNAKDSFEISSGPKGRQCVDDLSGRPFEPGFRAGVTSALAGAKSVLSVELTREVGEQEPRSLQMSMPPGLIASLRDVSTCSDSDIAEIEGRDPRSEVASPSCPPGSRVGVASATVGAGEEPLHLDSGRIYLAGPYQGSALSFVVVLPAVNEVLDLSTLAMRLPLTLDPSDGHLLFEAKLPTSQGGISLNLRRIKMEIDRAGFMANPTSCRARNIDARVEGSDGAVANVSSPFRIFGCASLVFDPALRMRVLGGLKAARHKAHPAIRAVLGTGKGDANLRRVAISFPDSELMDPTRIGRVCKRSEFAAGKCPPGSIYGHAKVSSPLLSTPLQGPVYLRSSDHKLPDLVTSVHGDFDLSLSGRIGFADGSVRVVMDDLPDVPVSKLALTMYGGRKGVFVNSQDLCAGSLFSSAEMKAQNGKTAKRTTKLDVPCRR